MFDASRCESRGMAYSFSSHVSEVLGSLAIGSKPLASYATWRRSRPGLSQVQAMYSPSQPTASSSQPITRSRTLFYLSIRDSSARRPIPYTDDDEREGLIRGQSSSVVDFKALPPRWVDTAEQVEASLAAVKLQVTKLDKLHAKHVLPGFVDRSAEEREIERQTSEITRDLRKAANLISTITPSPRAPRVESLTARNVQRALAAKVQEASAVFRKKQRVYMQKLQGHAIKNADLLAASGAVTLKGAERFDALQEDEAASQSQLAVQASRSTGIDIDQRTNELTQIASSISELAELFRDLGNMVVEQGTVLDSVEYNVQQTAAHAKGAVEELVVATKYQRNTGRRRCILLLVLIIVGLIIVLIYKPRGHSQPPNSPAPSAYPIPSPSARPKHHIIRPPSRPNNGIVPARPTFGSLDNDPQGLETLD